MYETLFLIAGLIILIAGGDILVRGASNIALRLKISPLVIGLTIVAFGTSSPELFISVQSALQGSPDMTMGNVIGSNICNLALVLGLTAVFSPININSNSIRIDWPMAMGSSFLLYVLVLENYLERQEGILFVIILIAYIFYLIRKSRQASKAIEAEKEETVIEEKTPLIKWGADFGLIIIGCLGLYFGSEWFVGSAKDIFIRMGVSERIIGIVVLAIGTSLPELVTSIVAALKKNTDLAIGNLMGSNIFNVLSILGITSIIKDIHVSSAIMGDMFWMLGVTLALLPLMVFKKRLGRLQGSILLSIYFYYTYSILIAA
ncbi:calcium/sodium antiporter [Chondrinema litorale]|uniref:calcium/sodium antiporter n=1 Tax=Chondrinema litorale TaxID=2994555 RepID=UPI002543610A|nr:calcium/sodium antiporter [Chondrinema litorale]UZR95589.1 calcium/sodium antiporter [Chondrinema litorale]